MIRVLARARHAMARQAAAPRIPGLPDEPPAGLPVCDGCRQQCRFASLDSPDPDIRAWANGYMTRNRLWRTATGKPPEGGNTE